jgi:hypothetical protein
MSIGIGERSASCPAGALESEPTMGPMGVVVGLVLGEEPHQMSTARHQGEVQQLVSDCSDEPLGEGVGLGARIGVRITRASSVVNTSSNALVNLASRSRIRNPTLFSRPSIARFRACWATPAIRVPGHPDDPDPPGPDLDQEQHVEGAQEHGLHSQEVTGQDSLSLGPQYRRVMVVVGSATPLIPHLSRTTPKIEG